jgi:23S rRNA (guanine745-N1)-methyltransferase
MKDVTGPMPWFSLWPLVCPVCGTGLGRQGGVVSCDNGHDFDVAREGYVNLLRITGRRPKHLGDSKEMLQARRRFLDGGHYEALSDAVNTLVRDLLTRSGNGYLKVGPTCIVDAGCGEGYYLGRLRRFLDSQDAAPRLSCFGMDFSKAAAKLAARRYPGIQFFVADVRSPLLFASDAVWVLLNLFAPRNPSEFARVLAPHGILLVVIPNPDHLANLREELGLLDIEAEKQKRLLEQLPSELQQVAERAVAYEIDLRHDDLLDLIRMTPSAWHLTERDWDGIQALGGSGSVTLPVRCWVSFKLLGFVKASVDSEGPSG